MVQGFQVSGSGLLAPIWRLREQNRIGRVVCVPVYVHLTWFLLAGVLGFRGLRFRGISWLKV